MKIIMMNSLIFRNKINNFTYRNSYNLLNASTISLNNCLIKIRNKIYLNIISYW